MIFHEKILICVNSARIHMKQHFNYTHDEQEKIFNTACHIQFDCGAMVDYINEYRNFGSQYHRELLERTLKVIQEPIKKYIYHSLLFKIHLFNYFRLIALEPLAKIIHQLISLTFLMSKLNQL